MNSPRFRMVVLVAIAVVMIAFLSKLDFSATAVYLRQLGAAAPFVLLPYACVLSCDTLAWRASFEQRQGLPFWQLWRIRVSTEALSNSLPAGVAVGETLKTVLLTRAFGLSLSDAAANVIVSKFTLAIAHVGFLFCGLWFGTAFFAEAGRPGLIGAYSAVLVAFFVVLVACVRLAQSAALSRLLAALIRVAPAGGGRWLARFTDPVQVLDESLAVIGRLPRTQVIASIGCYFLGWLALSFEDWLILALFSSHASFSTALSMEAIVSLVRMAFFFIPAGFGAQDVSYYALLNLTGMPDAEAVAAAFMLIKRAKEACWISLGYALLWLRSATGGERSLAV